MCHPRSWRAACARRRYTFSYAQAWAAALSLTLLLPAAGVAQPTGIVQGSVRTADDSPIANAVVTLRTSGSPSKAVTDKAGAFVMTGLRGGTYIVRATATGYDEIDGRAIEVASGRTTSIELTVTRSASSLVTIGQVRTKSGAAISTSSAPTTTIDTQTYAAQGYTRVSDVLQNDISTNLVRPLGGSSALYSAVALRGPDPTETLTDIDGHQVNSGNTGDFDYSLLDPSDYSSIELVKGISPSSLVGPDTIDGAVNIRTTEPTKTQQGMLRLFGGSFNSMGETLQYTGTSQRLGYAFSLHRTTTAGAINQAVLANSDGDSGRPQQQQVGSALDASTALAKLRYTFGRGDSSVTLSFHNQSQYRDLSAALSSFPGPSGSDDDDDAALRRVRDASPPLVNSFAGTSLAAHTSGYGLDARIPIGAPDAGGTSTTTALFRHYTSLVSQSVAGPGVDTSPYLYNDRDLITDDSLEIDHAFPNGILSVQYGVRNENLNTDFAPGIIVDESIGRRPLDDGVPSNPSGGNAIENVVLGQTQRTAAIRYTGDLSSHFHVAAAVYHSNYSDFGTSVDPRAGFTWTPTAQTVVRASVGTTFQSAQLPELLVPPVLPKPVGGVINIGNPHLIPDFATEYGLGFEHIFAQGPHQTDVALDLYRVNLRAPANALVPTPVEGCGATSNPCPLSYPINGGNQVYQGFELTLNRQLAPYSTLRAGWAVRSSFLTVVPPNIQDGSLVVGEQTLGLALQKGTLSYDYRPPHGLVAGAGLVYEGAYNELNQPPFAMLNANVGYRFHNFEVGLSGTNLTNQYAGRFTRLGMGVPYATVSGLTPTDAYALPGAAYIVTLTRRF